MDTNPILIHVRDADGKILLANQKFAETYDLSVSDVEGMTLTELYDHIGWHPPELERWLLEDRQIIHLNHLSTVIENLIHSGRTETWYQTRKLPIELGDGNKGILVISEDITTLKKAQEDLIHEHNLLESVFSAMPERVFVVNRDCRVINANRAYLDDVGISHEELLEASITDRLLQDHIAGEPDLNESPATEVFESGKSVQEQRIVTTKDRQKRIFDITSNPLKDGTGNIWAAVIVARDITAQHEMEQQLRMSQKMQAIGTLAGGIAHDFNNILFGITGYTEMAHEKLPPGHQIREYLSQVLSAAQRASDLVTQILTFSRQKETKRRAIQPQPLVKEVLKLLKASLPSSISIKQYVQPEFGSILIDPTQLHQVIMNLCTNAAQAMDETGGNLEVCLREVEVDKVLARHQLNLNPGRYVLLIVSDDGHGIPEEIRDQIFDPFFTTKESSAGTGMGLSTVHGIVQDAGGSIVVESELGTGTTFQVYFPVHAGEHGTCAAEISYPAPQGAGHVMVVDNDQMLVDLLSDRLTEWGYEVSSYTSSTEALNAFNLIPGDVRLVITDYSMPLMNGIELAQEILKTNNETRIVITTGFVRSNLENMVTELGLHACLLKPIAAKELAKTILKLLPEDAPSAGSGNTP
jgi:PAS domain S-box-containing protein